MSTAVSNPTVTEKAANQPDFQHHLQTVLEKLKKDPLTITADDARRLHEHFDAKDERSARIISAVEALALANQDLLTEKRPCLGQNGHVSLLTLVEDLLHAVDANPEDVTTEVLKLAQAAVSKCQKAISQTSPPHPELEAELQKEFARMEPKVEQGTVTKEEADHLHSLEARAHGHTEKGCLTAIAQSVAAKREHQAAREDSKDMPAMEKLTLGSQDGKGNESKGMTTELTNTTAVEAN